MSLIYKVYVKLDKWELIASFANLDDSVLYAISKKEKSEETYKVMSKHKNIKIFK